MVLSAATLLESIEGFLEVEDYLFLAGFDITRGLLHVDDFLISEFSIKVCTLDINLMDFIVEFGSHGQYSADGCEFGHRSIGVEVVNSWYLRETLGHKSHLIVFDFTSCIFLRSEDPLAAYDISSGRCVYQFPCIQSF